MIDPDNSAISIARQCELIHLPRSSCYRSVDDSPIAETSENLELMRLIDEEYTKHPFFGSRQLRNYLHRKELLQDGNASIGISMVKLSIQWLR